MSIPFETVDQFLVQKVLDNYKNFQFPLLISDLGYNFSKAFQVQFNRVIGIPLKTYIGLRLADRVTICVHPENATKFGVVPVGETPDWEKLDKFLRGRLAEERFEPGFFAAFVKALDFNRKRYYYLRERHFENIPASMPAPPETVEIERQFILTDYERNSPERAKIARAKIDKWIESKNDPKITRELFIRGAQRFDHTFQFTRVPEGSVQRSIYLPNV